MLDPLSALSLAAAIFQFVDLSSKILVTGYETFRSTAGATQEQVDLGELTHSLYKFQEQFETPANQQTPEQKSLKELAEKCRFLAGDLLILLEDLKVREQGLLRTWDAFRKSCRSIRKKSEIKRLQDLLESISAQISSRMLYMLREETSSVSKQLRNLEDTCNEIKVELTLDLRSAQETLLAKLEEQALALKKINLRRVKQGDAKIRTQYYSCLSLIPSKAQDLAEEAGKAAVSQRILRSLLFDEIKTRENQIHEAHEDTFSWIFNDTATTFKHWLASNTDDVFWVSGKAGSGKSTLMKFLAGHDTTYEILQRWAGDQWENENREDPRNDPWTRSELSSAIRDILDQGRLNARFCFFIDGLDEYADDAHGDHYRLIRDLDYLANTSQVKLCVSSRPWNVFIERYGAHPHCMLRLQDLTLLDMQRYIQDELHNDERFQRLAAREPQALTLATQIREKADGVFLWVHLVVLSLLRGLNEKDSTSELEQRLSEIPADLYTLFTKIIRDVDGAYRKYTIRVLQLASVANEPPRSTILWRVAQDVDNPTFAVKSAIEPLTKEEAITLRAKAAKSINKWCRDLLEIKSETFLNVGDDAVYFLHRTVKDFLLSEEVQLGIFNTPACTSSPYQALCRISLADAKAFNSREVDMVKTFAERVHLALMYARLCETREGIAPIETLQEFERVVMTALSRSARPLFSADYPVQTPLELMIRYDMISYVKHRLTSEPRLKAGVLNIPYIGGLYGPKRPYMPAEIWLSPSQAMVRSILQQGVDPNEAFSSKPDSSSTSAWHFFLRSAYEVTPIFDSSDEFYGIAKEMLEHGADPDARISVGGNDMDDVMDVETCLLPQMHEEDARKFHNLLEESRGRSRKGRREDVPEDNIPDPAPTGEKPSSKGVVSRRRKLKTALKNLLK